MHFIEIENFGWNAMTVAFLGTLFFGLYGAYGLVNQIRKVQREGAASVSVAWSLTFLAMFASYFPYGWQEHKLALILQFVLRVPFYLYLLPLIYKKRGGFTQVEWSIAAFLVLALSYSAVDTGSVFVGLSWLGVIMATDQPRQIWKKGAGAVSIQLLLAYWASIVFWITYGLVNWDTKILAWAPLYFVVYSTTIVLWAYRHRN